MRRGGREVLRLGCEVVRGLGLVLWYCFFLHMGRIGAFEDLLFRRKIGFAWSFCSSACFTVGRTKIESDLSLISI